MSEKLFDLSTPHRIAVLMGGWSPEREISLSSGDGVAAALRRQGHDVVEIDVGRDIASQLGAAKPDLCFNALHGVGGEDGTIQGVLETLAIPYTHSGVTASALAMNKALSKQIFGAIGLPLAKGKCVKPRARDKHPIPPPYVAKPNAQGSSIGVSIVKSNNEPVPDILIGAAQVTTDDVLVEAYVPGHELACAVIDDTPSCVVEIVPAQAFYDFEAKYQAGGSEHRIADGLAENIITQAREATLAAHRALGCRGVSRADFRYDPDGAGLILLEINSQPGMTPTSLVPEMAEHAGMSYDALVRWIAEDATCLR